MVWFVVLGAIVLVTVADKILSRLKWSFRAELSARLLALAGVFVLVAVLA